MVPGEWLHWINEEGATRNHHETRDAPDELLSGRAARPWCCVILRWFRCRHRGWAWLPI